MQHYCISFWLGESESQIRIQNINDSVPCDLLNSLADSTRYEAFEAFAEKLVAQGVRVFEEDDEDAMDVDGDVKDLSDEEGEEMLQDEFA